MSTTLSLSPRPSSSSDGSENNTSAPSNITTATLQDEEANALPLDATQSEEPFQECSNQQDTSSDDDDMTIITLEHNNDQNAAAALAWLDQNGPEIE